MKTKGIRVVDKENGHICVNLSDILKEISEGDSYFWSILYLYAFGYKGDMASKISEDKINKSERGVLITWKDLNFFSLQYDQFIDATIIGCKDQTILKRYPEQEMYETCDIVIVMFDSSYWEIFSKDESLINRLANKFKEVELLESDFLNFEK